MSTMTMHMPSKLPSKQPPASQTLRPASPGNSYQHQAWSGPSNVQPLSSANPGQGSAASNLTLALPLQGQSIALTNRSPVNPNLTANAGEGPITLTRIKLLDMIPEDGAPTGLYTRTVETLTASLMKHNAAILELGVEDAALVRCALQSAKLYFRSKRDPEGQDLTSWSGPDWAKCSGYVAESSRDIYLYRAGVSGRCNAEDMDSPPPGMAEVFRCLGKASRTSLSAIARQLRLRSDVFGHMLDDFPLPSGEVSSSVLTVTSYHPLGASGKSPIAGDGPMTQEVEKGLLLLVASDTPGLQVCDASGRWFLADNATGPGDLVLLTGKVLQHATAGVRKASRYRVVPLPPNPASGPVGRISLAFRLIPRSNATIDCIAMQEAGHPVPENFVSVTVAAFMESLSASEALISNDSENSLDTINASSKPSLRSCLTDPLSGEFWEDAMIAPCGHTYGGVTLKNVYETSMCVSCNAAVERSSLIPNIVLREAARAYKRDLHLKSTGPMKSLKRRREVADQADQHKSKRPHRIQSGSLSEKENLLRSSGKGVQYPFSVNERVMIKGNKRTPEKFVGREAHITSQCLNGWYLVKTLDNGESVRLQYRSLEKTTGKSISGGEESRNKGKSE